MVLGKVFEGPWHICKEDSLEEKPILKQGEILVHKSGNTLINCPKCNAMQFTAVKVEGDSSAPTLRGTIVCGAGHCTRCAFVFTVRAGRTEAVTGPPPPKKMIDWSKIPGTKRLPRLPE